jgi:hypothetical protein
MLFYNRQFHAIYLQFVSHEEMAMNQIEYINEWRKRKELYIIGNSLNSALFRFYCTQS